MIRKGLKKIPSRFLFYLEFEIQYIGSLNYGAGAGFQPPVKRARVKLDTLPHAKLAMSVAIGMTLK